MKRYLKLYPHYLAMAIKSKMVYRGEWFIAMLGFLISNLTNFLTLYLSTLPVSSVGGWDFKQIMFLYGFLLVPMGIDHTLTDHLWNYGMNLIKDGEMDRVLMKPVNPLFQMCAEFFQEAGLGELILGIVFMCIFGPMINLSIPPLTILAIVIGVLFSPLIYFAIKLFTMSLSFYFKRSVSIMSGIYNIKDFGKYPLSIYKTGHFFGELFYNLLIFILPFGLVGYLPLAAAFFPNQDIPFLWFYIPANNWLILAILIPVCLILFAISYLFFTFSIRHYESSGS